MNKVYTIFNEDEEELEDLKLSDISWDELTLFIIPNGGKPSFNSRVLWVVGYGGVARWFNLGDAQIMLDDIQEYCKTNKLPTGAKKEFIKACFNG